jgi:predicted metal-dependent HD superfamily phosphohydrolase
MDESERVAAGGEIRSHFLGIAEDLSAPSHLSEQWLEEILSRYTEPQRHYHTVSHISSMLQLSEKYENQIHNTVAVKLAILFHDFIYDPTAKDNEEQSAKYFKDFARDFKIQSETVVLVVEFIERTITHTTGSNSMGMVPDAIADLRLFLDFDLEVLARDPLKYMEYAAQIRQEYGHFPEGEYCVGRTAVLESFLGRERLYFSNAFFADNEARARSNLKSEIEYLQKKLSDL